MKTTHTKLLFAALLLISACKKTEYSNTSTTTQPVFSFNGNINNSPVNIEAGVNNYFMNTSYLLDGNGVYNYVGEFMTTGQPSTYPNSLEILFKDNTVGTPSNSKHIDSVITPGYFSFSIPITGMASAYNVQLNDFDNQTATNYAWDFGDGQSGTGLLHKPVHLYSRPGVYRVSVAISSGSCVSYDTNDVVVGQAGNAFTAPFSNGTFAGNKTSFSAVPSGVPPYTYTWNFGDPASGSGNTYTNTSNKDTGTHNFSSTGVYIVSVTTADITGYTTTERLNIPTPGASGCAGGFFEGTETPITNPKNLNDIVIDWYDNSGTLWTSENNKQSLKSMFHVTSVADYKNNAAGQATKIINAKISCKLYNTAGDSISMNGNAVFGVAHL
jgi:hypothetical protein